MATPNIVPRVAGEGGLGTDAKGWGKIHITNATASSASQGGRLILQADDGAVMGNGHRLGVVEFRGAEDTSATHAIGARIEALAAGTWGGSENKSDLLFYTTNATTESEVLKLSSNLAATFSGPIILRAPSVLNMTDGASIPITAAHANIDANGSARTGIIFAGAGVSGQMLTVQNSGGETLTFNATPANCLVRGMAGGTDTMEPLGVYLFVSDGTYWNFIGGGSSPNEGLTAA